MFYCQENPVVACAKNLRKRTRQKSARYWNLTCCKEGLACEEISVANLLILSA
jgi:hypothetical protein